MPCVAPIQVSVFPILVYFYVSIFSRPCQDGILLCERFLSQVTLGGILLNERFLLKWYPFRVAFLPQPPVGGSLLR